MRASSRRAFTLIELLVVVAIVVVLVAIMLPSLGEARNRAKTVACLSNIRQIGTGLYSYAQEYQNAWPYVADFSNPNAPHYWNENVLLPYMMPTRVYQTNDMHLRGTVFECPNAAPFVVSGASGRSYGYGMSRDLNNTSQDSYKRPHQINNPAVTAVAMDNAGPIAASDTTGARATERELGLARHTGLDGGGTLNTLFVDAHAEGLRRRQIPIFAGAGAGYGVYTNMQIRAFWKGVD